MRVRGKTLVVGAAVVALLAGGCGSGAKKPTSASGPGGAATTLAGGGASGNTASAPGVSKDTIKVGFITSQTGVAASSFSDSVVGAKAYFDAVNASGGVNGRKVQVVVADDQSTPTGNATATQELLSQGVFLIDNMSSFTFASYRITEKAGVPVTGGAFDGPEWGQQPNTNMFSTAGGTNGRTSNYLVTANFFKLVGATNVGALAYGISPSSVASVQDLKTGLGMVGLKMGYENLSVPFGGVDVTTYVLAMKAAGVDAVACSCVESTNIALFTGARQGGISVKAALSFASADSSLFANSTAAAAAQDSYASSLIPPLDQNNSASNAFVANVKAADPAYKGGYPSFGLTEAYLTAVLTVKGLQVAGQNPTRQSFIQNLAHVSNWDGDGLFASPISFNHFGTSEAQRCSYYVQVSGSDFKSINNGKPICGKSF